MIAALSNIIFLNPWILSGLVALPLVYILLQITPPPPKIIRLPSARFLEGLKPAHQTASKTPWWILLLRLLISALIIIALARPVHDPAQTLTGNNGLRLIIDNGWASAHIWDKQMRSAQDLIAQAQRNNRDIYIQTTANEPGKNESIYAGPLSGGQALSTLKGLTPHPWPADYGALNTKISTNEIAQNLESIWLSHGLNGGGVSAGLTTGKNAGRAKDLAKTLADQGSLAVISPTAEDMPIILKPAERIDAVLQIKLDAPAPIAPNLPVSVQALGEDGRLLDQKSLTLNPDELPLTVEFDVPQTLQNEVAQFRVNGLYGAGGTYILDERFKKRSVGIVGLEDQKETKPFIEASYYLTRALEPFTTIETGAISVILDSAPSVIILPDIAAIPTETLNRLEDWVEDGGLLLRFAGPNMAGGDGARPQTFLTPSPLRASTRITEGTLSWEDAPKLKTFDEQSPFYGLEINGDITVQKQILPLPDSGSNDQVKIWAALDDGTPLITARHLDGGLLVMVHTTASPDWSDLALSGTYVDILKRLVNLSGMSATQTQNTDGALHPIWTLNGYGARQAPNSTMRAIPAAQSGTTTPSAKTPPGLYGRAGYQVALNLGDHVKTLNALNGLPRSVTQTQYGTQYEQNLMPYILYAALILLLLDWLVMIAMASGFSRLTRNVAAIAFLAACLFGNGTAVQANELEYAKGLYLAYIKTGDPTIDAVSKRGLENLSNVLGRRTSAEALGVADLNPETDTLVFFPLIYWPVSETVQSLSAKALQNIQTYLDQGGTILFDTRNQPPQILQNMISGLNIAPLQPINKDHVLGRSFYLLDEFPGRYNNGTLWVESTSAGGRDGVSPVIIGSHDWAGAWAAQGSQRASLNGGRQRQEMAYRSGVNIIMYALSGNYKADQVHIPHILERLGQ